MAVVVTAEGLAIKPDWWIGCIVEH